MKAYIAGKITGDPDYREKFQKAEKILQAEGFTVLNPARLPEGMNTSDYMRICFAMIDVADWVFFLSDYRNSNGARLEYDYCQYIGRNFSHLHLGKSSLEEDGNG